MLELDTSYRDLAAYCCIFTDLEGNKWILPIDLNYYSKIEKYEELAGHTLCVLGIYDGFSDTYGCPVIYVGKFFDQNTENTIISKWYQSLHG